MPKKKGNIYRQYSHDVLEEAVTEYKAGALSLRKCAAKYGIPRSSISDNALGKITHPSAGKPAVIPAEIEKSIVQNAFEASERGLGLSRHQLMMKAGQVCKRLKIQTPFKHGIPGRDWYRGLSNRFPDISLRKPAKLSASRSRLDSSTVSDYFKKLSKVINENNIIVPRNIWNMDEKGVSLEHKPQSVVARKGTRQVAGKVSNNRENITIVAAINANGNKMPPLIIVKGKTHRSLHAYGTDEGPKDAVWTFQSNAWIEDVLGERWFSEVFLLHCGEHRPQLLILDQHKSHEVTGLLERAREEGIIILALPSHSSHWLQPLDKGVFGPLERKYNSVCTEYTSETGRVVTKCVWPKLFNTAWEQAMSADSIQSGFRATGIFPLNPDVLPAHAFAPSMEQKSVVGSKGDASHIASTAGSVDGSAVGGGFAVISGDGTPAVVGGDGTPAVVGGDGTPAVVGGDGTPAVISGDGTPAVVGGGGTPTGGGLAVGGGSGTAVGGGSGTAVGGGLAVTVGSGTAVGGGLAVVGGDGTPTGGGLADGGGDGTPAVDGLAVAGGDSLTVGDGGGMGVVAAGGGGLGMFGGNGTAVSGDGLDVFDGDSTAAGCGSLAVVPETIIQDISQTPSKSVPTVINLPLFPDLPEGSCMSVNISNSGEVSWNSEIEHIFLPKTPAKTVKKEAIKKKFSITKSRLLTSDEIVEEKRQKDIEKERKKQEAAERKKKREAKQRAQMLQQLFEKLVENH